jgi:hypothetical protein
VLADCADEDGSSFPVAMTLQGEIIPEYDVDPLEPNFELGVHESQVVHFSPNRMSEVYLKDALCSHACLSAKILDDRRSIEIKVNVDLCKAAPGFTPWVTVTTNSDVAPVMRLWCTIK